MGVDTLTDEQYLLLSREAGLAAMSLCEGLTCLRKTDFIQNAYALHAFFSVSVGMERMMKLILISEHRRSNDNAFPDNGFLKRFGHKINDLYAVCKTLADKLNKSHLYRDVESSPISKEIISFLNDFGDKARYYNLDTLTGITQANEEPLKRWHISVNQPIISLHYRQSRAAMLLEEHLANVDGVLVRHHDYSGNDITSLQQLVSNAQTIEVCRKYSVLYTYKILRFLSALLKEIDYPHLFPHLSEYFFQLTFDDKYVLTKKRWLLYSI